MSSPRNSAQAIAWARNQIVNPSQNWYRLCQTFVHDCFGIGGGAPTAYDAWVNSSHKHPVSSGSQIPAGVPVFWSGGSAGHTAISIGGGNCISTDIKRVGKPDVASIDGITSAWHKTLLGWTEDDNGVYIGKGIAVDGTTADDTNSLPGGAGGSYPSDVWGSTTNGVDVLLNANNWHPIPDPASSLLSGPRALMNDSPLLETVSVLCQASMRSFMAAPNGDFIAWFPDYFGIYGTAGTMTIRDIELAEDGFTMTWDDERLVTHQFTAGSSTGYSSGPAPTAGAAAVDIVQMIKTMGIATVEFPELMEALFNINSKDPRAKNFLNPQAILQRFGARPNFQPMGQISSPEAEFWYACQLFQQNWAAQFSSVVHLTFMPEVWPGMLLRLDTYGFQAYVEQVVHSFSFADGGGGFTTEVSVIAPSATKGGLYALPRGFAGSSSKKASSKKPKKKPKKKGSR